MVAALVGVVVPIRIQTGMLATRATSYFTVADV